MYDKGLDPVNDIPTRRDFIQRVTVQLNDMRRKGHVVKLGGRGPISRWSLS
jgi:hypothetical protein